MGSKIRIKPPFSINISPDISDADLEIVQDYWLHDGDRFVIKTNTLATKYELTPHQLRCKVKGYTHALVDHGLCIDCKEKELITQVNTRDGVDRERLRAFADVCDECIELRIERRNTEADSWFKPWKENILFEQSNAIPSLTIEALEPNEWLVLAKIIKHEIKTIERFFKHICGPKNGLQPGVAIRTLHKFRDRYLVRLDYKECGSLISTIDYDQALVDKVSELEAKSSQIKPGELPKTVNHSTTTDGIKYKYITV